LDKSEIASIFSNVVQLLDINKVLLNDMEEKKLSIAECFGKTVIYTLS